MTTTTVESLCCPGSRYPCDAAEGAGNAYSAEQIAQARFEALV
jgi:hypothetical protein